MSKIETTDEELMAMEMSYMMLTNKFMDDGFSPHACAAVMTKLAMMVYKSTLNAEDYNSMINSIADSRDQIKSFTEYSGGAGRLN
jgi:hypothetical protein